MPVSAANQQSVVRDGYRICPAVGGTARRFSNSPEGQEFTPLDSGQLRLSGRFGTPRKGVAIHECAKSVHNIDWFEVIETRGHVKDGSVAHFQVTMKVGFRIDNS